MTSNIALLEVDLLISQLKIRERIAENERLRVKVEELLEYFRLHEWDTTIFADFAVDLRAVIKGEIK